MTLAPTHPSNHWTPARFDEIVADEVEREVRVSAAYDRPIDRTVIRTAVIDSILRYAVPAGNG